MLVLSRLCDEVILIGDDIEVRVVDIRGDKVRLGITAPKRLTIHREEVFKAIRRENAAAARLKPSDLGNGKPDEQAINKAVERKGRRSPEPEAAAVASTQ